MRHSMQSNKRTRNRGRYHPAKLRRCIALGAACLVLLALAAPSIVAHSPLCNWIISYALRNLPLRVEVDQADLGWWREVEFRGVTLRDATGDVLARVPRLRGNRSLAGLLRDPSNLGEVELRGPAVYLRRTVHGTNWSDLGAAFPRRSSSSSRTATFRILAGQMVVEDQASGRRETLGPCAGQVTWAPERVAAEMQIDRPPGPKRPPYRPPHVVMLRLLAERQKEQWEVDAALDGDFAQLDLQGTSAQGEWRLTSDLSELFDQFGALLPAACTAMSGSAQLQGTWAASGNHRVDVGAHGRMKELRVENSAGDAWHEGQVDVAWEAIAQTTDDGRYQWTKFTGDVSASGDQIHCQRTSSAPFAAPISGDWMVNTQGNLARWQDRLRPWVEWPNGDSSGTVQASAQLKISPSQISAVELQVDMQGVNHRTRSGELHEPRLHLTGKVECDWKRGTLGTTDLSLMTTACSLRSTDLQWSWRTQRAPVGRLAVRGDLQRLQALLTSVLPTLPRFAGEATGTVVMSAQPSHSVDVDLQVKDLVIARVLESAAQVHPATNTPNRPLRRQGSWREPSVRLTLNGQWDPGDVSPTVNRLAARGSDWQLVADGSWNPASSGPDESMAGQFLADGPHLQARLAPHLQPLVDVQGNVRADFRFHPAVLLRSLPSTDAPKPHKDADLPSPRTRIEVTWERAALLGMPLGEGPVELVVTPEQIDLIPARLPLAGGHLFLAGTIRLTPTPTLVVPAGRIVENIHLQPQVCRHWLKYVEPLMADITEADGSFSIDIDALECPLDRPELTRCQGAIQMEHATLGPGPLAQQLIAAAQAVERLADTRFTPLRLPNRQEPWLVMPRQRIGILVDHQQVRHQEAQFQVDNLLLSTSGSVGLDQSLTVVARVPVQDSWIADTPWLHGLRGQYIAIPIGGTLRNPRLDARAVADLSRGLLRDAAVGAVQQELENQLLRLLKPK